MKGGMDFFSKDSSSIVNPKEMVTAFTHSKGESTLELSLEKMAILTFTSPDLQGMIQSGLPAKPVEAWRNRIPRIFRGEGWIAVRSPYGAPGTVMLLEELVAFGVRRVLLMGYCGALRKEIHIGDIILPLDAIREEGTSHHYLPKGRRICPDPSVQNQLSGWMKSAGLSFHQGTVWTTDAPYRETPEKVRRYCSEGVLGVEMEMAAAFAFGKARGISVGSVLIVSDEVREGGWRIGFFSPEIQTARVKMIQILRDHLHEMVPS
jgi:purine-nucleoside phosphorylase